MTSSLWPPKRRHADLGPWRISGSECDTTRSGATPWRSARPAAVPSTSWRTTWDTSPAASATSESPASSLLAAAPPNKVAGDNFERPSTRFMNCTDTPANLALERSRE